MATEFQSFAKKISDYINRFFSHSPSRIQKNSNIFIKNQLFMLQAYIIVVSVDMPTRNNLIELKRYSLTQYYNYSYEQNFWNRYINYLLSTTATCKCEKKITHLKTFINFYYKNITFIKNKRHILKKQVTN